MEAFCLAPIDVIKTRLQLDGTKQYKSILHCGTSVAEKEGVKALWKGVVPFATHLTFKYALRMGSNSFYQSLLRDDEGKLSQPRRLAAGALAGVTEAVCIVTPFEVVKIRLQQQKGMDKASMKYRVRCWIAPIVPSDCAPMRRRRACHTDHALALQCKAVRATLNCSTWQRAHRHAACDALWRASRHCCHCSWGLVPRPHHLARSRR